MAVKIRALSNAIQIFEETGPVVIASTTTIHSSVTALKADLQAKVDAFIQAGADQQTLGNAANGVLNS
jgi:hypothetical protein